MKTARDLPVDAGRSRRTEYQHALHESLGVEDGLTNGHMANTLFQIWKQWRVKIGLKRLPDGP